MLRRWPERSLQHYGTFRILADVAWDRQGIPDDINQAARLTGLSVTEIEPAWEFFRETCGQFDSGLLPMEMIAGVMEYQARFERAKDARLAQETAKKEKNQKKEILREIKSKIKTNISSDIRPDIKEEAANPASEVFTYWQSTLNHPTARLLPEREKLIEQRLKQGFTVAELKQAIDGCKASAYHQGENDRKTVFDSLELICRSGEKVEQFMNYVGKKHSGPSDDFAREIHEANLRDAARDEAHRQALKAERENGLPQRVSKADVNIDDYVLQEDE